MIGYPITYGDTLEEGNAFIPKVSAYWSKNQANFIKGYKFGLLVFGLSVVLLKSTATFASDSGVRPTNSGADRGASALGICGIAMKSGAYWIGFVCAAAVIIGVRMAAVPANDLMI